VRIHLLLCRGPANPRYTAAIKAPFALAMRGLKWFQQRLLLNHGIHAASEPIPPAEHSVLLGGETERKLPNRWARVPTRFTSTSNPSTGSSAFATVLR